ncbi:MAG TPA: hypothetical protein VJ936_10195 [Desulfobacteraceae bacterium]|nr:hypothetical protein [Desulfobacteraceae bacterium]
MKVLHILKSIPDDTLDKLFDTLAVDVEMGVVALYEEGLDWQALVDDIFDYDHVICWW